MKIRIEFKGLVYEREATDEIGEAFGHGIQLALDDEAWTGTPGFSDRENMKAAGIGSELRDLLVDATLPDASGDSYDDA